MFEAKVAGLGLVLPGPFPPHDPLDAIERALTLTVFIACTDVFVEQPTVADGASRVLIDVFGDAGRHSRSAIGVSALPRNGPVEVELTVVVRQ